jgi:hypothetical protein
MAIESILAQIDDEIAKLTQIRNLLTNTAAVARKAAGPKATKAQAKPRAKKRHVVSPEARKRIADAQRKRWAAQRAKSK